MVSKENIPWNKGKHIQTNTGKTHFKKGQIPWIRGKKHTSESLLKMSKSHKKALSNPEVRKRMSESHKGIIAGMTGKHHTEESKRKMSEAIKKAWNNPEKKKRMIEATKKAQSNPEVRKRMSESQKKIWSNQEHRKRMSEAHKGQIGWMKGKHLSEETKRKISKISKGQVPWIKGKHHSEEAKIKLSKAGKGRPAWNKGINFPAGSERAEWQIKVEKSSRERLLKQYESGKFPLQQNTKPERKIKEELLKRGYKEGIDFIHQYKFMNKFMCDFCFPQQKVIIEAYGDFWHCNPKKYPAPIHPHQIKDIQRDKSKEAYITKVDNHTWTYLVLWESDINKDVAKCVDRIEEVLKKKIK